MAAAAFSSVQAGAAKTRSDVQWCAAQFGVRVLARADGVEHVAFGEDTDARMIRVDHHRCAHMPR